jgi:hypothetical protein
MSTAVKKGKSPYAKFSKVRHQYSDHLNTWTAAIKAGDKAGAERADRRWRQVYAPCTLDADGHFNPQWRT